MNKKIFYLILVMLVIFTISASDLKEYIFLEFYYDGNLTLIKKDLGYGNYPEISHDAGQGYNFSLLSDADAILYFISFNPENLFSDSFNGTSTGGGLVLLNETTFFMAVPNFENVNKIEIFKGNQKILEEVIYDVGAKSCRVR